MIQLTYGSSVTPTGVTGTAAAAAVTTLATSTEAIAKFSIPDAASGNRKSSVRRHLRQFLTTVKAYLRY